MTVEKNTVHIAYIFDNDFEQYSLISLQSLLVNNDRNIHVHLICQELSGLSKKYLENLKLKYSFSVSIYNFDSHQKKIIQFPDYHKKKIINLKIFISEILPKDLDKIIYVDGDTIILKSLSELYDEDMTKYPIAAALDASNKTMSEIHKLDYYCNAGVLLFNLKMFRDQNLSEKICDFFYHNKPYLRFPEQCLLNLFFNTKIKKISNRWNNQISLGYTKDTNQDLKNSSILHFITPSKPWHLWFEHSSREFFIKYKDMSPWKDIPLVNPKTDWEKWAYARSLFRKKLFTQSCREYFDLITSIDNKQQEASMLFLKANINENSVEKIYTYEKVLRIIYKNVWVN